MFAHPLRHAMVVDSDRPYPTTPQPTESAEATLPHIRPNLV